MPEQKYKPALQVTPNDSTDLSFTASAVYVTGAGNVKATLADGSVVTMAAAANSVLPCAVNRVWATGTTATGIIGLSKEATHLLPSGKLVTT